MQDNNRLRWLRLTIRIVRQQVGQLGSAAAGLDGGHPHGEALSPAGPHLRDRSEQPRNGAHDGAGRRRRRGRPQHRLGLA